MASRALREAPWATPSAFAAVASTAWLLFRHQPSDPQIVIGAIAAAVIGLHLGQIVVVLLRILQDAGGFLDHARRACIPIYRRTFGRFHLGLSAHFLSVSLLAAVVWMVVFNVLLPMSADEQLSSAFVIASAGLVATIGWIFTAYITARNAQRQNTLTLLLNMRHSEIYSRHFNNAYFLTQNPVLLNDRDECYRLDKSAKWRRDNEDCDPIKVPQAAVTVRSAYQSVIYVLNYYEFIAVGVRSGALDADLVSKTISAHLLAYYKIFGHWIAAERSEAGSVAPYEQLEWYSWKFPKRPKKPLRLPNPASAAHAT